MADKTEVSRSSRLAKMGNKPRLLSKKAMKSAKGGQMFLVFQFKLVQVKTVS